MGDSDILIPDLLVGISRWGRQLTLFGILVPLFILPSGLSVISIVLLEADGEWLIRWMRLLCIPAVARATGLQSKRESDGASRATRQNFR